MSYKREVAPHEPSPDTEARCLPNRRRAALGLALVLSLLLHAPLLLLLIWLHRPSSTRSVPVEVELVTPPPPRPPPAEVERSEPVVVQRPASTRSDLYRRRPKADLRLFPWSPLTGPVSKGVPLGRERRSGADAQRATPSIGRTISRGGNHPGQYFDDLRRALLQAWQAQLSPSDLERSNWLARLGENAELYWRVWRERAATYGRTGILPSSDATNRELARIDALPHAPSAEALRASETSRWMRQQSATSSRAVVRIVHRADGALVSVDLVSPSGNPLIDADALRSLREAEERLPHPPPEILRGRRTLVSLWELEIETAISPPTAALALHWDEVAGKGDLRAPLDRRSSRKVRLLRYE